jgi:hypothetical protein
MNKSVSSSAAAFISLAAPGVSFAQVTVDAIAAPGRVSTVGSFTMASVFGQASQLQAVRVDAVTFEPGFLCIEEADLPIAGDLNLDGVVDGIDLATLLARWGPCSLQVCVGDIDRSGKVDGIDLAILLANWG